MFVTGKKLGDNTNADEKIEQFAVDSIIVSVRNTTNFYIKISWFFQATPEVKTPYSMFIHHFKLLLLVAFHDVILDVILYEDVFNCQWVA